MKKFFAEFKAFAMRGNVIDLAVGVVVGGAFGGITTSLVNDMILPFVSLLTGGLDFTAWKWVLREAVLDAEGAEITAAVSVNYGNFISVILNFIIVAFAIFCVVKALNKAHELTEKKKEEVPAAPPEPSAEEKLLTEIRDLLRSK